MLNTLKTYYDNYAEAAQQARNKSNFFDNFLGTGSAANKHPCHEQFYEDIKGNLTADGTTFYRARTGQKYYFGDAVIEILWTFEDIAPHNIYEDRTNPTCIGFSIEIAGQKLMITGDTSTEEFLVAGIRYGDYLKSDIVQLSHHGYGDGNVNHDFYKYVNAPYVINSGLGASYGAGERWAMENAEVYILREHFGTCVIPLPYNGGEFEHTMEPPEEAPEEAQ